MVVVVAVDVDADDFEEVAGVAVVAAVVLVPVPVAVDVLVAGVVVAEVEVNCSDAAMWMAAAEVGVEVGGTCPGNDLGAVNLPPTFQRSETAAKLASGSCAKSMVNVCAGVHRSARPNHDGRGVAGWEGGGAHD